MRPLFIVLAKLLGLIQAFWALTNVWQVVLTFNTMMGSHATDIFGPVKAVAYMLLYLALYLFVAWLLLMRTDWLADKLGIHGEGEWGALNEDAFLKTGVKLIGVYILVYAIPAFIQTMLGYGMFSARRIGNPFWPKIIPATLQLLLGTLLAIRSERTLALIGKAEHTDGRRVFLVGMGFFFLVLLLGLSVSSGREDTYRTSHVDRSTTTESTSAQVEDVTNFFKGACRTEYVSPQMTNGLPMTNWQNLKIRMN